MVLRIASGAFGEDDPQVQAIGGSFGRWTVLSTGMVSDDRGNATMFVQCQCGSQELRRWSSLRRGETRACWRCRARGPDGRFVHLNS